MGCDVLYMPIGLVIDTLRCSMGHWVQRQERAS